ncbi:MAG: ABC transporter substrate-binding protein [Prevotellaceae bacterium]|nr:ABC transporter substrate-binding protein [Prevotellaceae bacterium]
MKKVISFTVVTLIVLQIITVLASWLVTAMMPELSWHSLLSSEGIRWFFGQFVRLQLSPLLLWLIIGSMAYGAFTGCGVTRLRRPLGYSDRLALRWSVITALIGIAVMTVLVALPHALLLSVTGDLFPSAFSRSLIPFICLQTIISSLTFGVLSGRLSDVFSCIVVVTRGIAKAAPLFLIEVLAMELYRSVEFILKSV